MSERNTPALAGSADAKPAGASAKPWERCKDHGPAQPQVWACPTCLVELREQSLRLRAVLFDVLNSGVGKQTLAQLAAGQGVATKEGKAWLAAASVLGPEAVDASVWRQVQQQGADDGEGLNATKQGSLPSFDFAEDDRIDTLSRAQLAGLARSEIDLFLRYLQSETRFDVPRIRLLLELGGVEAARRLAAAQASKAPESFNVSGVDEPDSP